MRRSQFPNRLTTNAFLLLAGFGCLAGTECPNQPNNNNSGFPHTVAWTQTTINDSAGVGPSALQAADFDGDDLTDLVIGYQGFEDNPPRVVILFREDNGSFTPITLLEGDNIFGVTALAVADMDDDDRLDIIAAATDRVVYFHAPENQRDEDAWTAFEINESNADDIGQWNDVAIGDIDGINGPDIAACGQEVGRLCWFRSPNASTINGTGWQRIDIDIETREGASAVLLSDVNGDQRIDIISAAPGEEENRIAWYQNPADPRTEEWTSFPIGNLSAVARLAIGDLNTDGRPDVVAIDPPGGGVGWYAKPEDPTTTWTGLLLTVYDEAFPVDLAVADVDGNNQLDVVVSSRAPGALRWFTPVGSLSDEWVENNLIDFATTIEGGRFVLSDFDGNQRPDVIGCLIGATADEDEIARWENPEP